MKRPILRIGYSAFLLPSDKGLQTLLTALKGCVRISGATYLGDGVYQYEFGEEDDAEVSVSYTSSKTRFVTKGGEVVDISTGRVRVERQALKPAKARAALPPRNSQSTLALE